jgi:hypothetical protein
VYKTNTLPSPLYRSENWITKARESRRITAAEIKYVEKQEDTLGQITQKRRDRKGIKYNPIFGQNTELQKKLVGQVAQSV